MLNSLELKDIVEAVKACVSGGSGAVTALSYVGGILTVTNSNGSTVTVPITATSAPNRVSIFTPTAGQTVFLLAPAPTDALSIEFTVNGASYDSGSGFFTVAGSTVTWTGPYGLTTTDTVSISYI